MNFFLFIPFPVGYFPLLSVIANQFNGQGLYQNLIGFCFGHLLFFVDQALPLYYNIAPTKPPTWWKILFEPRRVVLERAMQE